jgi:hypothetical protein
VKRTLRYAFPKPVRRKGRGWEKRDWAETAARQFKDKRSYVGFRVHPGTSHCCVYLFGDDVTALRVQIFHAAHGLCWKCGQWVGWFDGEMHHRKGGLGRQRCYCIENQAWSCAGCHRPEHMQVRLGRIGATV